MSTKPNPFARHWTPAEDKEALRLMAEGLSFREIGLAMGLTKNAVISRAKRRNWYKNTPRTKKRLPQTFPARACCLYAVNDQLPYQWCGEPTDGGSWCAEHHKRVSEKVSGPSGFKFEAWT